MLQRPSIREFLETIARSRKVLGARGMRWLATSIVSSLGLSLVEYSLVAFLQVFLVSLGYFDRAQTPAFLLPLVSLSPRGLCILLVVIGALRSAGLFISSYSNDMTQEIVSYRLKQATLYEFLLRKGRHFLPASDVNFRLIELYPKSQTFLLCAISISLNLIQAFFLVAGMLYLGWRETLLGLVGFSFVGLILALANQKLAQNSRLVPGITAAFVKGVERVSRNWLFIRISRTQNKESLGLLDRVFEYFDVTMRISAYNTMILGLPPFFGICLFAVIIYVSRAVFLTKATVLISILYLFLRLVQYIGNASNYMGGFTRNYPQYSQAVALFCTMDAAELDEALSYDPRNYRERLGGASAGEAHAAAASAPGAAPDIAIRDLAFAWENSPRVLDRLSWSVKGGEIAGIVGPSGSGKSTLLLLILGMLEPVGGAIEIGGVSPSAYFERSSGGLGYVGAEPFLMAGTLEENLAYGLDAKPSEAEFWSALEQAQLAETVRKLDRGLGHRLDENGTGLSTGQKQRLALARALLRKPKILILDEATANLDAATELEIANTIKRLGGRTTVLIVSHRAGFLTAADHVLELKPNV